MDIIVEKNTFLKALSRVQRAVEKRGALPQLENVKLATCNGGLILTCTDLTVALIETIASKNTQDGAITVSAIKLRNIVAKLPDGNEVRLQSDDSNEKLKLTCAKSKFSLVSISADDFPSTGETDLPINFSISAADLLNLVQNTSFAMSTDETRYYLNGVYLHTKESEADGGKSLIAVATDGHRLAKMAVDAPEDCNFPEGVIIPRRAISELLLLCKHSDGAIEVALSDSTIRFSIGSIILVSKLVDGGYPDYEKVIPHNPKKVRLDCSNFKIVVDRVSTISSQKPCGVKLSLSKGGLKISAVDPSQGSAEEDMVAEYDDEDLSLGFNANFLIDIVKRVETKTNDDKLEIYMDDITVPALMCCKGNPNVLFVLMPMRI